MGQIRHGCAKGVIPPIVGGCGSGIFSVVGKRFAKRQQMRWSKRGAHLLLQTPTRALDGTLRTKFEQWYPGLAVTAPDQKPEAAPCLMPRASLMYSRQCCGCIE